VRHAQIVAGVLVLLGLSFVAYHMWAFFLDTADKQLVAQNVLPAAVEVAEPSFVDTTDPNDLLPDLLPLPPRDLKVEKLADGRTLLYFSTTYYNQGRGIGSALLEAAENDARELGAKGMAAWGLWLPFWMKASWFKKHGYKGPLVVEPGGDATTDLSDFHGLMKTWRLFGSPIYGIGAGLSGAARPKTWGDVQYGYFGQGQPPYFVFGQYSPSEDWSLWSGVRME